MPAIGMQRKQAKEKKRQEEEFESMFGDVLSGLSNETGIMGETQYTLNHSQRIKVGNDSF